MKQKDIKIFEAYLSCVTPIKEKLDPKSDASVWITDFQNSTDSKFDGKSKEDRKKMALAAWYAARKEAGITEADDGDGKVENKDELMSLATSLAKNVHGDVDKEKVSNIVDEAIEDNTKDGTTDWKAASGFITGVYTGK